jgi:post-segregation antitoxin (ccd killing protein)
MNTNDDTQNWAAINAEALEQHRHWVEVHGTFGEKVRAWKLRQSKNTNEETDR